MNGLTLVAALVGGMAIGAFFFGGLWLTIGYLERTTRPAMLLLGSFMGRTVLALSGLFVLAWGRWERLAIAVVGFLVARIVVVNVLGRLEVKPYGIESRSN